MDLCCNPDAKWYFEWRLNEHMLSHYKQAKQSNRVKQVGNGRQKNTQIVISWLWQLQEFLSQCLIQENLI